MADKKNILKIWAYLFTLALFFGIGELPVKAADDSIVVEPSKMEIVANPGDKILKNFLIVNRSSLPARMKVYSKDYRVVDENGNIETYDKESESARDWLVPDYVELTLMPLQTKVMQFIATVSENMSGGGHYGAVVFEPVISSENQGGKPFGLTVLMTVAKNGITTGGKISEFSSGLVHGGGPIDFDLKIKNLGNTHLKSNASIDIVNWRGDKVAHFEAGELLVYPETERLFKLRWMEHPLFGPFRAYVNIDNSIKKDAKMEAGLWFFVVPWKAYFVLPIGLIFLALIFIALGRKKIKTNKASQSAGEKIETIAV